MSTPNVNQQKKLVYKPKIVDDKKVTYRNSKGQNVTTHFYDECLCLPKALNKIVTGKTPNVTKLALEEAVWENSNTMYEHQFGSYNDVVLKRAEKLIEHYAEKISEGEQKGVITQSEQFSIMEQWHKWFGYR